MSQLPSRLGVVGAGTMGAGIAQLGCLASIETLMHDPVPGALERGEQSVRTGLAKGAQRGRWSEDDAREAGGRLRLCDELEDLADCELVIEAAPERPELKRELFERLSEICGEKTVLASNTSSILVSSLAAAAARPENVVGMHFFNPPPLMRLLEVIAAAQTGERALEIARAVGEAMGKTVIVASDGPGFLVNRCGRPVNGESLRLLQERVASIEQIDRIARLGGGFRMGPFELMDLVGIDVGYEVARSFNEQSFGESRWKPSMLQAKMVAAGTLGRKTGSGWYSYEDGKPHRPDDEDPPEPGGGDGRVVAIEGHGALADALRERGVAAGFDVGGGEPELVVHVTPGEAVDPRGAPVVVLCADRSLAAHAIPGAVGFHLLPPIGRLVELTRLPDTRDEVAEAAERFFTSLGFHHEWVADAPGLVLGRLVCQLVNEALFAIGEGVGSPDDVDAGTTLGLNHPRGPVTWGREIGFDHVLATLDGLWDERREERYRAAPLLRRIVATGESIS
ncbi:MAG TPA: 3-hydroxyacyl-CoA dehydrogenase NAD-binding domain-containing protein [Thermoleophilaceae bacterium]